MKKNYAEKQEHRDGKSQRMDEERKPMADTRGSSDGGGAEVEVEGVHGNDATKVFSRRYGDRVNVLIDRFTVAYADERLKVRREECWGLWDTGSDVTSISRKLAERLGADVVDGGRINTAIGYEDAGATVVTISIGDIMVMWHPVRVVTFKNDDHPDIIIGMDIINKGRFEVDSSSSATVVTFEI